MTKNYLNEICEEINEILEEKQQVHLFIKVYVSELALKYSFPLAFMKQVILERL